MQQSAYVNAAHKYRTTPDNIAIHVNPDSNITYYKRAEYDSNGKYMGYYQPITNRFGYIQLSIYGTGPLLKLIKP